MIFAEIGNAKFQDVSRKRLAKQIANYYVENNLGEPWIDNLYLIREEEYELEGYICLFRVLVEEECEAKLWNYQEYAAYVKEQQACAATYGG